MKTSLYFKSALVAISSLAMFGFSSMAQDKRLAPDGVNTITENKDGSSTSTLLNVVQSKRLKEYDQGFNMALDAIALLNLELQLKGERKTFGEMAEILRQRFGVTKDDK